jgi:hypothetical protein
MLSIKFGYFRPAASARALALALNSGFSKVLSLEGRGFLFFHGEDFCRVMVQV